MSSKNGANNATRRVGACFLTRPLAFAMPRGGSSKSRPQGSPISRSPMGFPQVKGICGIGRRGFRRMRNGLCHGRKSAPGESASAHGYSPFRHFHRRIFHTTLFPIVNEMFFYKRVWLYNRPRKKPILPYFYFLSRQASLQIFMANFFP